jgi:putative ABC transport system permease protein
MIRVALKELAARPLRTALTTLAIVLGVAMVSGALTLTDTMRGGADALSTSAYEGTTAVVAAPTAFAVGSDEWAVARPRVEAAVLDRVRAVPEVAVAVGDVMDEARVIGRDGRPVGNGPYFGVGRDARAGEALTPFRLADGRWAAGPGEVVLDLGTAERAGYALGERARIATRGAAREFTVVGLARFGAVESLGTATAAVFDLEAARELFRTGDAYDAILVRGREGVAPAAVREALAGALGAAAQVERAAEHDRFDLDGLDAFIAIIRVVLLVFAGVAVLVGAFTIVNTLSITVAQRTRELALLRMVGAGRRQVLGIVLAEALALGLVASAVGVVAGLGLARGLEEVIDALALDLPDAGIVFRARTVVVAMLVGTLVTCAAALVPALRATRVEPVAALRGAAGGEPRVGRVGRVVRAAVGVAGRPAQALGASAGTLARRNAMRQPGRTLATAAALTVGVALVTLLTVVAEGLRDTTTGSLERRVAATHVVTGTDGWSPIDPQAERALARTPGVRTATSVRQDMGRAFGDTEVVNAVDPARIGQVLDFDWKEGSAATLAGLGRDGAVVDEGWATEHGLAVGERFTLTSASGAELELTVRGVEESPILDALGLGPITVGTGAFEAAFAAERNLVTLVAAAEGADLRGALAAFPDANVQGRAAWIDERAAGVDRLLAIFSVLLALAVVVSLFGIVNALVLATFERTRELGTLRALGMTRRQVRRMVRHEGVIIALLGAGLGIALGLGLAGVVTSVFAEQGLAFALPAGTLGAFTAVAVLAGVLAAVLPARRAARLDPIVALTHA